MGCVPSASIDHRVDILSRTPLFTLEQDELWDLAGYFKVKKYNNGDVIVREDEKGDEFFVISNGEVAVTAADVTKKEIFLCKKKKGDFFGDQALFQPEYRRNATVVANGPTEVLVLDKGSFNDYLSEAPRGMREKLAGIMGQGMVSILEKIAMFEGLGEYKLQLLASLFEYLTVEKDRVICRQGDPGGEMFIVSSGSVKVLGQNDDDGPETEIAVLHAGNYFGEIALMVDMPRTASVLSMQDCLLLVLKKSEFTNFLQVAPFLRDRFELLAKQRIAEIFKKFEVPFFAQIPDELFKQLADLCSYENYGPDRTIFKEGDMGSTFYIIVYGYIDVYAERNGSKTRVNRMGPGRYFGEIALIRNVTRTATVVTSTRCVLLGLTQEKFSSFFKKHPESFADFEIKLARKDASLAAVINHKLGLEYFAKHLQSEYSSENINFYKAVCEYEQLFLSPHAKEAFAVPHKSASELVALRREVRERAESIVQLYVSPEAKEQVNIPSEQRDRIFKAIQQGRITPELFAEAKEEILRLMSRDSYKRFTTSSSFDEFLHKIGAYTEQERTRTLTRSPTGLSSSSSTNSLIGRGDSSSTADLLKVKDVKLNSSLLDEVEEDY